jgi:hypothetical protein
MRGASGAPDALVVPYAAIALTLYYFDLEARPGVSSGRASVAIPFDELPGLHG